MKEIIYGEQVESVVHFKRVRPTKPIFAKKHSRLVGMVVEEDRGWVLRLGGKSGCNGFHPSLENLLTSCEVYDYTFHVED